MTDALLSDRKCPKCGQARELVAHPAQENRVAAYCPPCFGKNPFYSAPRPAAQKPHQEAAPDTRPLDPNEVEKNGE